MIAEILSVGTELLLGDIVNTNSAYIAKQLSAIGIGCYHQTVVGDNPTRLKTAVEVALSRSDILIISGGLGPTYDDLTKETVADYLGLKLELHQPSYDMLVKFFENFNRPMTENNKKQAMMPQGAIIFENDRGTANGLAIEKDGKIAIMLPGPPRELTAMFERSVKPFLSAKSDRVFVSSNIHFFGVGEAQLEQELHEYMTAQTNPTIAPYAKEGEVLLRVTASACTEQQARELLSPVVKTISNQYASSIYGVDVGSLQQALVELLRDKNKTIATAESCTGGLISKRITEISGVSEVFGFGVCSYANEAKLKALGVSPATLDQYGAVSAETACEMASGIRKLSGADYGLSTTGIAGPDGGSDEKPVGLVYVGISSLEGEQFLKLNLSRGYGDEREYIRYSASSYALNFALKTIMADANKKV